MDTPARSRVVVLDADALLRRLMREILEEFGGYRVDAPPEGEDGYGLVRATRPDAVVLDPGPPIGSSVGALDRLAADPATRGIPLVLCCGDPRAAEERWPSLARAGVATVKKPFGIDDLLGGVAEALRGIGDRGSTGRPPARDRDRDAAMVCRPDGPPEPGS